MLTPVEVHCLLMEDNASCLGFKKGCDGWSELGGGHKHLNDVSGDLQGVGQLYQFR